MRKLQVAFIMLWLAYSISACGTNQIGRKQAEIESPPANAGPINGFTRAIPGRILSFPKDFGPHPDFQTEWWYYTGNLSTASGRRFGYQLTFFRKALIPQDEVSPRSSNWATSQAYMAHFALTDAVDQRHYAFERLERGAAGLAGAQANPFHVWLFDWNVEQTGPGVYILHAAQDKLEITLKLADHREPILNGENGYSQKGPGTGYASYYFSQPHLITDGSIQIGSQEYSISGTSWMDHEFSTSALSNGQIGWDWFSIQLNNQSELMFYQIRRADGSIDPFSSGTLISENGTLIHLQRDDFKISVSETWRSPVTKTTYPSGWTVSIPKEGLTLIISPLINDQELNLSYSYWEGAVTIRGEQRGNLLGGFGYVELTGYSGSIAGQF